MGTTHKVYCATHGMTRTSEVAGQCPWDVSGALDPRVDQLEELKTRVTATETDIADHEDRITALENP